jgi:predicted metalloendopeptidase
MRLLLVILTACGGGSSGLDLEAIDSDIEPCDDFYQYACGGWIAAHPIASDGSASRRFSDPFYDAVPRLRAIVEEASLSAAALDEKLVAQHYLACLAAPGVLDTRSQLKALVDPISQASTMEELALAIAELRELGSIAFFGFRVEIDLLDSTRYVANLDPGGVELPDRSYYLEAQESDLRDRYRQHIGRLSQLVLGRTIDADAVLGVETALAAAFLPAEEQNDWEELVHRMSRDEVAALAPAFPWQVYWDAIGYGDIDSLNVALPSYLTALEQLFTEVPLEDLKSYLSWQLLQDRSRYLDQAVLQLDFDFWSTFSGRTEPSARDWTCFVDTLNQFSRSISRLYFARHFRPQLLRVADEMSEDIRLTFEARLDQASWLDAATHDEARAKLDALRLLTGHPPERWPTLEGLDLTGKAYFDVRTELIRFYHEDERRRLAGMVDDAEYLITPVVNNAFYHPQFNAIQLGLLMHAPTFVDASAVRAFSYGALGAVIGHELTHGFDDSGRHFDAEGDLRDWWSAEAKAGFDERAQCLVDQYDAYEALPGEYVNGRLTLGENIADLGGLVTSFEAMKLEDDGGAEGYGAEQIFFLAFAQSWCASFRPEFLSNLLLTDPHAPSEFRVNGVVSNIPEFKEAFDCSAGDAMVRESPCVVW